MAGGAQYCINRDRGVLFAIKNQKVMEPFHPPGTQALQPAVFPRSLSTYAGRSGDLVESLACGSQKALRGLGISFRDPGPDLGQIKDHLAAFVDGLHAAFCKPLRFNRARPSLRTSPRSALVHALEGLVNR